MKDFRDFINRFPDGTSFWFLHSHPDDESYLTAGVMQHLALKGCEIHTVYLSASVCEKQPASIQRQSEARQACAVLNVKNIHFLNYCESSCQTHDHVRISEVDLVKVRDEIFSLIDINKQGKNNGAKVFFSYDEKGGYGHVDHLFLYEVGRLISELGYSVLEATLDRNKFFEWIRRSKLRGLDEKLLPLESYWINDPWLSEERISYFYQLTPQELQSKKRALLEHVSQVHPDQFPGGLSAEDFRKVFGVEYFVEVEQ